MPATHLAFLRGINVGGKNKLPMQELSALFRQVGCGNVRTYIQSGNVLFEADLDLASQLPGIITGQIEQRFGYRVPLVLRTATELGDVLRHNPFLAQGVPEDTLHVLFLAGWPSADCVVSLDPDRSPPDTFIVRGREIYLQLPQGAARTKLTNAYFDSRLATISTIRNWRTVSTLFALLAT